MSATPATPVEAVDGVGDRSTASATGAGRRRIAIMSASPATPLEAVDGVGDRSTRMPPTPATPNAVCGCGGDASIYQF
jgi:hypothetical protein